MRKFIDLDISSLKAFYYASEYLNFTKASQAASMTQSGISQHISKLEEILEISLFQRSPKMVKLTEAGSELRHFVEKYLDLTEVLAESIQKSGTTLSGLVKYAMPDSCLFTPHFSMLLAARSKDFKEVGFKVKICSSDEVMQDVLDGNVDFGFVTKKYEYRDIVIKEFASERYVLVSKDNIRNFTLKDISAYGFINYPGMDVFFANWSKTVFKKTLGLLSQDIKGEINSLKGAIEMTKQGVGLALFPLHCVENEIKNKELYIVGDKNKFYENPIYLIRQNNLKPIKRIETVIDAFWNMKR